MMASATESTITIAVAADSPPTNASRVMTSAPLLTAAGQHEHVGVVVPLGRVSRPAAAIGTTNRLISTR